MQNYTDIASTDTLAASLAKLLNNDKTALSCSSGTAFPTTNLQVGMLCFRTDLGALYELKNATPTWVKVWDTAYSYENYTLMMSAECALVGGGTVSYSATGDLKWTSRFILIGTGRGSHGSSAGYFDINMPGVGTVITGVGGQTNVTVTSAGIPMTNWTTLYYVLPLGGNNTSSDANFRMVSYTADFVVPVNWLVIAQRNHDTPHIRLGTGLILRPGESFSHADNSSATAPYADSLVPRTTANRPATPAAGRMQFNTDTGAAEVYNGSAWQPMGGGASGGGNDSIFFLNDKTVTTSYSIPAGKNAMTAGPISIANGVTVTIPDGSVWTIV